MHSSEEPLVSAKATLAGNEANSESKTGVDSAAKEALTACTIEAKQSGE